MLKLGVLLFITAILPFNLILAHNTSNALQVILDHKEECVQMIDHEKIYLMPESLQIRNQCFAIELADNQEVLMPYLLQDSNGYFIQCAGRYYWECTTSGCGMAYSSSGGPPPRCSGCGKSSFVKVLV